MSPVVRNLDQPWRAKHGTCRLCGARGALTRTHVPPRAAGNDGAASPPTRVLGPDGVWRYGRGRERDGGMWGRWFCEPCNNRTGRFDEEYVRWSRDLFGLMHGSGETGNRV